MGVERMVANIESSSSDELYEIVVTFGSTRILASCTCQAGKYRRWCKHKTEVVEQLGDKARSTSIWKLLGEIGRIDGMIEELRNDRKRQFVN